MMRAVRDFCKTLRCLGLGRFADRRLELVHFRQFGDELVLKLGTQLNQQFLDRFAELFVRLREDVQGSRLVICGRGGGDLAEAFFGRLHACAGTNQVFSQRDADVSQPGRGLSEGVGGGAVLGLVAGAAAKFGLGDRALGLRHLFVQPIELFPQQAECFFLGATAALESASSRCGHRIGQMGVGAP